MLTRAARGAGSDALTVLAGEAVREEQAGIASGDDGSTIDEEGEPKEEWALNRFVPPGTILSKNPTLCQGTDGEGCEFGCCAGLVFTSTLTGEEWHSCLRCQEKAFGGWPEKKEDIPLRALDDNHWEALRNCCSNDPEAEIRPLPASLKRKAKEDADSDGDGAAPPAKRAKKGKSNTEEEEDGEGEEGEGGKDDYYARKARAHKRYATEREEYAAGREARGECKPSEEQVKPSAATERKLENAEVGFEGGAGDIVDFLLSTGKLTLLRLPYAEKNEDLQKILEQFNDEVYTDLLQERDALDTGGPDMYFRLKAILEKPKYKVIKDRIERVAKACDCKVNCTFIIFYLAGQRRRSVRKKFAGGARYHGDIFSFRSTILRGLDTFGTPAEGKKIMSFKDMKTGRVVHLSIPHGTVVFMSTVCAGNDFGEYEHAVSGAWGTGFMSTDFADADE